MDELEEMRAQMVLLKQKLDSQLTISDQYLRRITSERVQRLNRAVWIEGVCCLFVVTFGNLVFYQLGLSVWFMIATCVLMIACFLITLIPHQRVQRDSILQGDLLSVAKQVRGLRALYHRWLYIGIPIALAWIVWMCLELYHIQSGNLHVFMTTIGGAFAGGVIGGVIGYMQHRKLVKEMDSIIQDIEQER